MTDRVETDGPRRGKEQPRLHVYEMGLFAIPRGASNPNPRRF